MVGCGERRERRRRERSGAAIRGSESIVDVIVMRFCGMERWNRDGLFLVN